MKKIKKFLLGINIIWLPIFGCYIANKIIELIETIFIT